MSDTFEVKNVTRSEISPGVEGQPSAMTLRCVGCDVEFSARRATNLSAGTFSKMGGVNTYNVFCPSGKHRGHLTLPPESSD